MQLKFYARPEHLQPWPDSHSFGQPRRYIGWQWVAGDEAKRQPASYVPKKEGDVVDTDLLSDAHVDQIRKACAKGAFWSGDPATAEACGIAFTKLDFTPEGFVPAKAAPEPPKKPSKE